MTPEPTALEFYDEDGNPIPPSQPPEIVEVELTPRWFVVAEDAWPESPAVLVSRAGGFAPEIDDLLYVPRTGEALWVRWTLPTPLSGRVWVGVQRGIVTSAAAIVRGEDLLVVGNVPDLVG